MAYKGKRRQEIKNVKGRIDKIFSFFSEELWKNGTILDVGCGHGRRGLMHYFNRGVVPSNCTVLDALEDKMLNLKESGCKCVVADLEENSIITETSGLFDIIICSHFLEHITQGCENRLLVDFAKIGSNVVICYPEKPTITKGKKIKYGHIRRPNLDVIVKNLQNNFIEVTTALKLSQIFIIAKDKKSEI